MQSGSMLIDNYLGERTLLKISNSIATANPPENSLIDARRALKKERENRIVSEGNVKFLVDWIAYYSKSAVSVATRAQEIPPDYQQSKFLHAPLRGVPSIIPHYTKVPVLPRHA